MNKLFKYTLVIIGFILAYLILRKMHNTSSEKFISNIKKSMKVNSGKIYKLKNNYKTADDFLYSFSFNSKGYFGSKYMSSAINYASFLNTEFPVIFDSLDPKRNEMLIFKEDFEEFGLVYPDSLKWTEKYNPY